MGYGEGLVIDVFVGRSLARKQARFPTIKRPRLDI